MAPSKMITTRNPMAAVVEAVPIDSENGSHATA
jgi:hypothetical protein